MVPWVFHSHGFNHCTKIKPSGRIKLPLVDSYIYHSYYYNDSIDSRFYRNSSKENDWRRIISAIQCTTLSTNAGLGLGLIYQLYSALIKLWLPIIYNHLLTLNKLDVIKRMLHIIILTKIMKTLDKKKTGIRSDLNLFIQTFVNIQNIPMHKRFNALQID